MSQTYSPATLNPLVRLIREIEMDLSQERGPFILFAPLMRQDTLRQWDLVVSAPWLRGSLLESTKYLSDIIQSKLSIEDVLKLSKIVILDPDNTFVNHLTSTVQVIHGDVEMKNTSLNGIEVDHAYIITSNKETHSSAATL